MAENRETDAINSRDEWAVTGGKVPALARTSPALPGPASGAADEPRFGERLRFEVREIPDDRFCRAKAFRWRKIADAIDLDRDAYRHHLLVLCAEQEAERLRVLRRQVEAAVERLKYELTTWEKADRHELVPSRKNEREVVDVDDLITSLADIFGPESEEP